MEAHSPPLKRAKYDLVNTFDIVVGKEPSSQRFTVHTDVLTSRSKFLKAARKPEWLTDHKKPVDLQDEQPDVFSRYLNCVYFGMEALRIDADAPMDDRPQEDEGDPTCQGPDAFSFPPGEIAEIEKECATQGDYLEYVNQCLRIFTDVYLLADRLQDMETANLIMDELIRFGRKKEECFNSKIIWRVYNSTVHGNPLRKLIRDECTYEKDSSNYMQMHTDNNHPEFLRDVLVEFLRLRDFNLAKEVGEVYMRPDSVDKCLYHQHSETHPRCVPEPVNELEPSTVEKQG